MNSKFFDRVFSVTLTHLLLVAIIAAMSFMVACGEDSNPIVDEHDEEESEHVDADGFVLKVDEVDVYEQFQGNHTGGLTVSAGEEIVVEVVFLNDHKEEIQHEEHDDEHEEDEDDALSLSLTEYDSNIIEIHLSDEDEDHDEDEEHDEHGLYSFEVIGLNQGSTEIKLQLLHGGHADFSAALLIPVKVN
ncbi:hypothetical protein JT359_05270 [Candidatus Poribacteria bacterium]|nr:hypothetical protein [Candidatus Poribacteria bacterium]